MRSSISRTHLLKIAACVGALAAGCTPSGRGPAGASAQATLAATNAQFQRFLPPSVGKAPEREPFFARPWDATFDTLADGSLAARFETAAVPKVRPQRARPEVLSLRGNLSSRLPAVASGAVRVEVPDQAGAWIEEKLAKAGGEKAEVVDGRVVYAHARPGVDRIFEVSSRRAEEYLRIEGASALEGISYEVDVGERIANLITDGSGFGLVAVDAQGKPVLKAPQPRGLDAAGKPVEGKLIASRMGEHRFEIRLELPAGIRFPVLLDPSWVDPASMAAARFSHAAARLASGEVLVTGGSGEGGNLDSAELYDPITKTFSATGNLNVGHAYHTATLLDSGKVLIEGGSGIAELYDPVTGTFTATTGSPALARTSPTATLLPSGKVLIAGGDPAGFPGTAELYDPTTDTFSATTGALHGTRRQHTATLLASGKVLLAGGFGAADAGGNAALSSAELYDPDTGLFTLTGSLASARSAHTATLFASGKVLFAGGYNSSGALDSAELYDPGTGTVTATGSLAEAHSAQVATLLPSGKVLVAGGEGVASCELYDPNLKSFAAGPTLEFARRWPTLTVLASGEVLVVGGFGDSGALASAELYVDNPGVFDPTGSLTSPRPAPGTAGATLLPSGKVLVVGGLDSTTWNTLPNAELYDPATGVFATAGALVLGRYEHTVTLLPSGKVLVAGGGTDLGGGSGSNSAELYDPGTDTFSPTGSLIEGRMNHTATVLPSGKVLVVGGSSSTSGNPSSALDGAKASAELYDPNTGTFTQTGTMAAARTFHTATLLPSGKVLIAGGGGPGSALDSAELYDPSTGTFTGTIGDFGGVRMFHTATLLPSGKVLIAGGLASDSVPLDTAELYDPGTNSFTATGNLSVARGLHTATLMPSGKVLIVGGSSDSIFQSNGWNNAELYDPSTGTFSPTSSLIEGRESHTAILLPSGKVLIEGGASLGAGQALGELYDGSTGTFVATGGLAAAHEDHSATLLPSNEVLIAGGSDGTGVLASAALYRPSTGTFAVTGDLLTARKDHTATLLLSGEVLIAGGEGSTGVLDSAEVFAPGAGTFAATGHLVTARSGHTATLLPGGEVLFAGGEGSAGVLNSAELFDPGAGTFAGTGNLATARTDHTATLLPNGEVLIAGGEGSGGVLSSAELFDPGARTFTPTGDLAFAREGHTATLLPSGRVLVTGGTGASGPLNSAELFDPGTGTFTATGDLVIARTGHKATLLASGEVLITGGDGASGHHLTELYDPATGLFTSTADFGVAFEGHTATLLSSGQVLITGGTDGSVVFTGAALYDRGQGFADSARPVLSSLPARAISGSILTLGGSNLLGVGEASGGQGISNSATNFPIALFQRLGSEQRFTVGLSDPSGVWSQTSSTLRAQLPAMPAGVYRVWLSTSGIPSQSATLVIGAAQGASCSQAGFCASGFCTDGVCCDGACGGSATNDCQACSVAAGAAVDGTCGAVPDATSCEDGDHCTAGDFCSAGACVSGAASACTCSQPSDCPPPTQCQASASCEGDVCVYADLSDGTGCDDGRTCSSSDSCQAGVCVGDASTCGCSSDADCAPLDGCHLAGTCDLDTGTCSTPAKPDGTGCDDQNACTASDTCESGICAGAAPVACAAASACQEAQTCDAATGTCVSHPVSDGTACEGGTCTAGACVPSEPGAGLTETPPEKCGCGTTGADPLALLLGLGLLLLGRRERGQRAR